MEIVLTEAEVVVAIKNYIKEELGVTGVKREYMEVEIDHGDECNPPAFTVHIDMEIRAI
jgi:hypothetical protein